MFRTAAFGAATFGGWQWYSNSKSSNNNYSAAAFCANPKWNHQGAAQDIAALLDKNPALGPTFIRLAWHAAGVFSCRKGDASGNPNSAGMRFAPECDHGANAGLAGARAALEPVKKKYSGASYADLWALAGTTAILYMGCAAPVAWRWGRKDAASGKEANQDANRLPDAMQGAGHIRDVFGRMGFSDREAVCLIGAHAVGECHAEASGFVGPWTHSKYLFSNEFFVALLNEKWTVDKTKKQKQYTDAATGKLMMLPADLAIREDPAFLKIATEYANDNDLFCREFAAAWQKLVELGQHHLESCDAINLE